MKIISKFKDFYDYKVAKYGMDEKLVYIRKTYSEYLFFKGWDSLVLINRISEDEFNDKFKKDIDFFYTKKNFHKILFVGEKLVHLFFTENGIYTHFDIKYSEDLTKNYKNIWFWTSKFISSFGTHKKDITFNDGKKYTINSNFYYNWLELLSYSREKILRDMSTSLDNSYLNEPIVLIEPIGNGSEKIRYYLRSSKFTYNPNLTKLGIYIDEDFIWQSLVEFLSNKRSEKEIVPDVSDKNKILSKGFDLKSSFRPKIKKKK